ncbi:MAG: DUF2283 domain-containing protein [Planctomycetes bacterium]|nr:DUF2283 domain-containing protein [Planctomycetota bacterium]
MAKFEFEITGTVGDEGRIELAYIRVAKGDVAKTVEIDGDRLLADYDEQGNLIGIEILAPIDTLKLRAIIPTDQFEAIERALPEILKAA